MAAVPEAAVAALRTALGDAGLRQGAAVAALDPGWRADNLGAGIVASPGSLAELVAIVGICRRFGVGLVPQGGRTGLVGGGVSVPGTLVLSTARLDRIESLDPVSRVAVVESGVPLQALQEAAGEHGLEPGIDLPSRGSATIGGMVSTNAGGIMAFRNGVMRHRVLGLEAVLADGSVMTDLTRVVKNAAGYDLKQLFIGGEGTLGIVTRVALKLDPLPLATATVMIGLPSVAAALATIRLALDGEAGTLRAAEAMWQPYIRFSAAAHGFADAGVDLDAPIVLLLGLGGADEATLRAGVERLFERVLDLVPEATGLVGASARQDRALWELREDTHVIYRAFPDSPSYDVSLPLAAVETYVAGIRTGLRALDAALDPFVYGHLADGNLHVALNRPGPLDDAAAEAVEGVLYRGLAAVGGSFSAEHGVGLKRQRALLRSADPTKLATMRAIKRLLDPQGLLNPGKVLPAETPPTR